MCEVHSFRCDTHLFKSDGTLSRRFGKAMDLNVTASIDSMCSVENSTTFSTSTKHQATSTFVHQKPSENCTVDSGYHSWSNIPCSVDDGDVLALPVSQRVNMQSAELNSEQQNILNSSGVVVVSCQNSCLRSRGTACGRPRMGLTENSEMFKEPIHSLYSGDVDSNANHIPQCKNTLQLDSQLSKLSPHKNGVRRSFSNSIDLYSNTTDITPSFQNELFQESQCACTTAASHFGDVKQRVLEELDQTNSDFKSDVHDLAIKIEFCLMFGYMSSQIRSAIKKLSCSASKNDILAELSSMQSAPASRSSPGIRYINQDYKDSLGDLHPCETDRERVGELITKGCDSSSSDETLQARGPLTLDNEHKESDTEKATEEDYKNLRPIVIDGSNVAMSHGNKQYFSCKGILLAVDFFRKRNHRDITVFVPNYRKESRRPDAPTRDREILKKLEEERILVYTPSRCINGKRITCYDDRFILKLAQDSEGVIVSNDHFRDLQNEKPEWKELVSKRLLMYSFASDRFMPPDDPLGRNGPSIDNFLRKRPASEEQSRPQCPYGKKCTYGKKCKYFHPECARSITDSLKKKSDKRMRASSMAKQLAGELIIADNSKTGCEHQKIPSQQIKSSNQRMSPPVDENHNSDPRDTKSPPSNRLKADNVRQPQQQQQARTNPYNCEQGDCQSAPANGSDYEHPCVSHHARLVAGHGSHDPAATTTYPQFPSSCDGLSESLRHQLTIAGHLQNSHSHLSSCRRGSSSSNQICYDPQGQVYPMMSDSPRVHSSFSNPRVSHQQYVYPTEVGPPDFHTDNHPNLNKRMINQPNIQQYQRSSPATLHMYDGRSNTAPAIHPHHVNMTAPYQRVSGLHAAYGMPSRQVYRTGYGEVQYPNHPQTAPQPQQMIYPYPMSGNTRSAPGLHHSMVPAPYYVSSISPSTGSESSLSHSYPFMATPDGQVIAPVQKDLSSSNNSDAKTYPPPRMPRRVYSSPNHAPPNAHQVPHSPSQPNPNYHVDAHMHQLNHHMLHASANGPPLSSPDHPRHHLFQNLCGLFQRSIVEKVMNSYPNITEPKVIIEKCLQESD